MKSNNNEELQ